MWTDWEKHIKPNTKIPAHLLWDMDLKTFDMQKGRALVAERVAERGELEDFYTMFAMYGGVEGVRKIYKDEVSHIDLYSLPFICVAFNIKKEELKCYIKAQLRQKRLNS